MYCVCVWVKREGKELESRIVNLFMLSIELLFSIGTGLGGVAIRDK
jgi:hypothetical protein